MDYNDLNSFLGNLEIGKNSNKNNSEDTFVRNEFNAINQFSDSTVSKKPSSKKQIENVLLNRNQDLSNFQTGSFNFETINPQRIKQVSGREISNDNMLEKLDSKNKQKQDQNVDFELNRNLQVNNLIPTHVNVMDYTQFSENYKSYKNNSKIDYDKDKLNEKLSSRDSIPNITSVPSNLWK
jgi:hypothetical protein